MWIYLPSGCSPSAQELDGAVRSRLMDTRTGVVVELQGQDYRPQRGGAA